MSISPAFRFQPYYALFAFIPISWVLAGLHVNQLWTFLAAALAIVPLAALMGQATEELSKRLGPQWGGLINATFGNATELIIGIVALHSGLIVLVRASIVGSVIGNILLVLGASTLAGGIRFKLQYFNLEIAQTHSINLLLATMSLAIPAIFAAAFGSSRSATNISVADLTVGVSVLLLASYVLSLLFSLRTHEELFRGGEESYVEPPTWSKAAAIAVLGAVTLFLAYESEVLVRCVEPATRALGINQIFVGIIIIPIIGNAAEHATALSMALKNKLDITLNISIGSSTQVAMFVAPVLALLSFSLGHPMSYIFSVPELTATAFAVVIAAFIARDGKTHWLEGAQLLIAYCIIALAFYYLPR